MEGKMKRTFKINRNQFMKGLLGAGVLSFFPFISKAANKPQPSQQKLINNLIKVLNEQGAYFGDQLDKIQITNLKYAVDQIKPSNHQELAFVVACGNQGQRFNFIVNEYVKRRNGEKSLLFDHPILALETWGRPNTQRILIFKEQIQTLLSELTGLTENYKLYRKLLWGHRIKRLNPNTYKGISLNEFHDVLSKKYRQLLNDNEIMMIYYTLINHISFARPYTWCSTMATRASFLESQTFGEL